MSAKAAFTACLEEITFNNGFVDRTQLLTRARLFEKTGYGQYLHTLANAARQRWKLSASCAARSLRR